MNLVAAAAAYELSCCCRDLFLFLSPSQRQATSYE